MAQAQPRTVTTDCSISWAVKGALSLMRRVLSWTLMHLSFSLEPMDRAICTLFYTSPHWPTLRSSVSYDTDPGEASVSRSTDQQIQFNNGARNGRVRPRIACFPRPCQTDRVPMLILASIPVHACHAWYGPAFCCVVRFSPAQPRPVCGTFSGP